MSESQAKWLSDKKVAERYGIARVTVWRWAREGHLPRPKRIGPKSSRWSLAELDARDEAIDDGTYPKYSGFEKGDNE